VAVPAWLRPRVSVTAPHGCAATARAAALEKEMPRGRSGESMLTLEPRLPAQRDGAPSREGGVWVSYIVIPVVCAAMS
jgi:hypothetical protein